MNAESLRAIVTLIVTVAVNVANAAGYALNADLWFNVLFSVLSLVTVAWSWWKNQNVTEAAQQAQIYLNELKGKHANVKYPEDYEE